MALINRAATYRGRITGHGVGVTTNEFPQWVVNLLATEIWDVEEQQWVDWTGYDENEITGYLVLFGGNGETLNCKQVEKATGWDGSSFEDLDVMDLSDIGMQFRVENTIYYPPDGEPRDILKVNWIDEFDATPGCAVRKLEPGELKQLTAKYLASKKKVTPAKAKPEIPKKVKKQPETDESKLDLPSPKQPGTIKVKGKPGKPSKPVAKKEKPVIPQATTDAPQDSCTKQEAWDAVVEARADGVSDEDLAKHWLNAVSQFGNGKPQELLSENEWAAVRDKVISQVAKF